MIELRKSYSPEEIEDKWYSVWENDGYFKPNPNATKSPFCIVIPPPNVTGSLHMGHALNVTIQDVICRWKRMLGHEVLWLPGTDHAGIATQNVVERELSKEGLDRHKLGREEFIKRVWKWKEEYGSRIIHQLKKLGASCDWSKERFTLDEGLSRAVREVFVRLFEEGLIYRDKRLINWCPRCQTALSDLEVEYEEIDGRLYYIKYPLALDQNVHDHDFIVVATTRPETMLGDTAVAVHPEDERYKDFIGKKLNLPLTGRQIPVIADTAVDPTFGTGAVKVTPAHDFNDEIIGERHGLKAISVIEKDGRMSTEAGQRYMGLDRYVCRKRVLEDLNELGLLQGDKKHPHSVGHCYRCKTIIEPMLTIQWYVKVKSLAVDAVKAVEEKRIRLIPKEWENNFFAWMRDIRDWCISRQIWWGHQIPVWYCPQCKDENNMPLAICQRQDPTECPKCGSKDIVRDPDVLDTWFSSALWPFSTLGWPDDTEDLKKFYPTDVLVTGFDILFFWVARMIMMGLKFMNDVPFRDVYVHALVRDLKGQKMSKSKGNVIDPLLMIEKYGADAFRFTLSAFAAQGRDIRFSEERVEGYRHFINKLWNAAKYIVNVQQSTSSDSQAFIEGLETIEVSTLSERWILHRLAITVDEVNRNLANYRFNDAANAIYQFVWHEFCDWYIELTKPVIYQRSESEKNEVIKCLLFVLEKTLRLLHPFMPFVTEELCKTIFKNSKSITISKYPEELPKYPDEDRKMNYIMDAVTAIRSIRGELNIPPSLEIMADIKTLSNEVEKILKDNLFAIKKLARCKEVNVGADIKRAKGSAISVKEKIEVYVPIDGLLDIKTEIDRLKKEKAKLDEAIIFLNKKLMNEDFLKNAPKDIVQKEKVKFDDLINRRNKIEENIRVLQTVGSQR